MLAILRDLLFRTLVFFCGDTGDSGDKVLNRLIFFNEQSISLGTFPVTKIPRVVTDHSRKFLCYRTCHHCHQCHRKNKHTPIRKKGKHGEQGNKSCRCALSVFPEILSRRNYREQCFLFVSSNHFRRTASSPKMFPMFPVFPLFHDIGGT